MSIKTPIRNKFNQAWFADDLLSEWLSEVSNNRSRAFCKFCGFTLRARFSVLKEHANTLRHKSNAEKIKNGTLEISVKSYSPAASSRSSVRPAPKSKRIRSVSLSSVENVGSYAYVDDGIYHPVEPSSILPTSCKPKEFSETPDIPGEDSAIPYVAESSEPFGFLPSSAMGEAACGPSSSHGVLYNYCREESDDVNYLFGLCIAASLKKCSEEQASLARLKIQTILHQASLNELPL